MTRQDQFEHAVHFCETIQEGKIEPRAIIMCGVGQGIECKVFQRYWPKVIIIGVDPLRPGGAFQGLHVQAALVGPDSPPVVTFWLRHRKRDCSSLFPPRNRKAMSVKVEAETVTLDEIFNAVIRHGPVALWMDCEGAELEALSGGLKCLQETRWLLAEIVDTVKVRTRKGHPRAGYILRLLRRQGFVQVWHNGSDKMFVRSGE
jgi:hypothetical protein